MQKTIGGAVAIGIGLAGLVCGSPAGAIENHVQSTPTDLFFFGAGFTPPPTPAGTFGLREALGDGAGLDDQGKKPLIKGKATVLVSTLSWVYMTNLNLLGANYGFVVVQPYFYMNGGIKGSIPVSPTFSVGINQRGHNTGFGNTQIYPIVLQWVDLPHLAVNASVAVQLPDGRYSKTSLLNPSTNYWTVSPNFALTYITDFGQEFSTYQEIDFNTENPDTRIHSGTEYKMTVSTGQHLGDFTVGPTGYYYQQLENDSGAGTRNPVYDAHAARVFAAGAAFNYVPRGKPYAVFGDVMQEFGARSHLQGIAASIRVGYSF